MTASMDSNATTFDAAPVRTDVPAVADVIFRTGAAFDGFTAQMRRAFDLNAHERLALAALWSNGPLTMTDLGAWIPLSRAAVTTLVDRLEDYGLVRRGSDASDRRRTVVEITQSALDRMMPVIANWGTDLGELLEQMSDEEWRTVNTFLNALSTLNVRHADRLRAMDDDDIQALAASAV